MSSLNRNGSTTPKSKWKIHIVVDNSNLFIGAQLGQGINGKQDSSIRINVANLVETIEKNIKPSNIKTRLVGGSIPPRNARVWTEWEKSNYTCLLGEKSLRKKEVFLDDMLHSQIQNLILKKKNDEENNIQHSLILITGDGNSNDNRTSFPDIVKIALDYGWTVQIWSWKAALSYQFSLIQQKYPSKIQINYLDTFRSFITFKEKQKPKQKEQQFNYFQFFIFTVFLLVLLFIIYYFNIK